MPLSGSKSSRTPLRCAVQSLSLPSARTDPHTPQDLRKFLNRQLKTLNTEYAPSMTLPANRTNISVARSSIDMWYLHGPDRTTPYEDTLRGVNDLYKEGKFKRFGSSNYMA